VRRAQKNPPKHLKDGGIMIAKGGEKPSGNDCHEAKVVTMAWVGGMGVGHLGGGAYGHGHGQDGAYRCMAYKVMLTQDINSYA
jgi:hypothetical protein